MAQQTLSNTFQDSGQIILPDDPECGTHETVAQAAKILMALNIEDAQPR